MNALSKRPALIQMVRTIVVVMMDTPAMGRYV